MTAAASVSTSWLLVIRPTSSPLQPYAASPTSSWLASTMPRAVLATRLAASASPCCAHNTSGRRLHARGRCRMRWRVGVMRHEASLSEMQAHAGYNMPPYPSVVTWAEARTYFCGPALPAFPFH